MAKGIKLNERALKQVLNQAAKNYGKQVQPELDRFAKQHEGQAANTIKPKLDRWLKAHGLSGFSSADLSTWAEIISRGGRVELR